MGEKRETFESFSKRFNINRSYPRGEPANGKLNLCLTIAVCLGEGIKTREAKNSDKRKSNLV
jgi:hypothetical protein